MRFLSASLLSTGNDHWVVSIISQTKGYFHPHKLFCSDRESIVITFIFNAWLSSSYKCQ